MNQYEQAEEHRKNGEYEQALGLFRAIYTHQPYASVAWRIAYCLRKLDRFEEAEQHARDSLERFPDNQPLKSELGWTLYERYLRDEDINLARKIAIAEEILTLCDDNDFLKARVVFTMILAAKDRSKWETVVGWCEKVSPEELSAEPREIDNRNVMSEREVYFIAFTKALVELEDYQRAHAIALQAKEMFPDSLYIKRNLALALSGLDRDEEALEILRHLLRHPRSDWYLLQDLARVEYKSGNTELAYRICCEILIEKSRNQDVKFLVGLLEDTANVAAALGKWEHAYHYATLARDIRVQHEWSIPQTLESLVQNVQRTLREQNQSLTPLPDDSTALLRECTRLWREESPILRGRLLPPREPQQRYTFVQAENQQRYYVDLRRLRRTIEQQNIQYNDCVEFGTSTAYDSRRQEYALEVKWMRRCRDNPNPSN